jgi:hypothetical protein
MMQYSAEKMTGEILVEEKIITGDQLNAALRLQKERPVQYLGEILIKMGIPQEKIVTALCHSGKRRMVGEILLDLKLIKSVQLGEVLAEQRYLQFKMGVRKPIGLILFDRGYINYHEYLTVLSKHFNMPVVSLKDHLPSRPLQRLLGEKYTREHDIIVLENTATTIRMALAEPTMYVMEKIHRLLPPEKAVEFYLASHSEIALCLEKIFESFILNPYPDFRDFLIPLR